jgi:Mg-chelatase subunit ChlD
LKQLLRDHFKTKEREKKMNTFRTTPSTHYIPPSKSEMRQAADHVGLRSFSPSLVEDMCNLAAGGTVNPPSSYTEKLRQQILEEFPEADRDGEWPVPKKFRSENGGGSYTKNRSKAFEWGVREKVDYHQNISDFVESLNIDKFPGQSPLEKTMAALKLLSKKQGGQPGGGEGDVLPIFQESDNPEGEAKHLEDTMDSVDSLSEEELDMIDPDGENKNPDGQLNTLKTAEDLMGPKNSTMLEISRTLDALSKLRIRRSQKVEVSVDGEEVRSRRMNGLSELAKIEKSAWALRQQNPTYFLYKATTKQFSVRERITRQDKKQCIFILIDGSGSMRGERHHKATGVVMNRLKAVLSGDAEVYLSVFDSRLGEIWSATNPEEARELIKKFAKENFWGGSTDIAGCVKAAHNKISEMIDAGRNLHHPEIVVLTDDDGSSARMSKKDVPNTVVHGFSMGCKNPALIKFCRSTGGVGIENF